MAESPENGTVPLYYEPAAAADKKGEAVLSSESMKANTRCLTEIKDALTEQKADGTWEVGIYETLTETYGTERTAFALYTAMGYDITSEGYDDRNRDWAIGLYAPYYFKNEGVPAVYPEYRDLTCDPARLNDFVTGFRSYAAKDLEGLFWQHERGEAYPPLKTGPAKKDAPEREVIETLYSDHLNRGCEKKLARLSDSVMGEDTERQYLMDILDEYGRYRTFSVLISFALDALKGSLSEENIRWVFKQGNTFCREVQIKEREGEISLLLDPYGLDRLLALAVPISDRAGDINGRYEAAYLFGAPVLYSEERIRDYEIPEHFSCYELSASDSFPERYTLTETAPEKTFAGTVLAFCKIPGGKEGGLLFSDTDLLFSGSELTSAEFMNLMPAIGSATIEREMEEGILLGNEKRLLSRNASEEAGLFGIYRKKEKSTVLSSQNDAVFEKPETGAGEDYALIYFSEVPEGVKGPEELYRELNSKISENRVHLKKSGPASYGHFSEHIGNGDILMLNVKGEVSSFYVSEYRIPDEKGARLTDTEFSSLPEFADERRAKTGYTQTHLIEPAGVPFDEKNKEVRR